VRPQILDVQHLEPGAAGLTKDRGQCCEFASRKYVPLQKQGFWTVGRTLRANDPMVKEEALIFEKIVRFAEIFLKAFPADMLEHSDRGHFLESALEVSVVTFVDLHLLLKILFNEDSGC
jgi:hypothetical protein